MIGHALLDEPDRHDHDENAESFLILVARGEAPFGQPWDLS